VKSSIFSIILITFCINVDAQSVFDNVESKLTNKLTISVGGQFVYYKKSHIQFYQSEYDRDLTIYNADGSGRGRFNEVIKGEVGCTQYRIDLKYRLSSKYSLQLEAVHLDYLVDLSKKYYLNGTWDGNRINQEEALYGKFLLLEHSNGINIWKLGVARKWQVANNWKPYLLISPQIGVVFSATQAEILSQYNDYESYDPGNTLVGMNYSLGAEIGLRVFKNINLYLNATYFQMNLEKAKISETSHVTQSLRGCNYGLNIALSF